MWFIEIVLMQVGIVFKQLTRSCARAVTRVRSRTSYGAASSWRDTKARRWAPVTPITSNTGSQGSSHPVVCFRRSAQATTAAEVAQATTTTRPTTTATITTTTAVAILRTTTTAAAAAVRHMRDKTASLPARHRHTVQVATTPVPARRTRVGFALVRAADVDCGLGCLGFFPSQSISVSSHYSHYSCRLRLVN